MEKKIITSPRIVTDRFDAAASQYDKNAPVQSIVARRLVEWAQSRDEVTKPYRHIIDIGCGTGLVTQAIAQNWPRAAIVALDRAPDMVDEAKKKVPAIIPIVADAAHIDIRPRTFDAAFSSMMLHWLPDPASALQNWRGLLKPQGKAFTALMVQGSFNEWTDICTLHGAKPGTWQFPARDFAKGQVTGIHKETIVHEFPSAQAFIKHLKAIGAATPKRDHAPMSPKILHRILENAPRPFPVTYKVLYIESPALSL